MTRKLTLVGEDLRALEPLSALAVEEFATGGVNEALAERYLERAIGRMIDVNYHLITELGGAPPRDYFESFVRLADHGGDGWPVRAPYRVLCGSPQSHRPRI